MYENNNMLSINVKLWKYMSIIVDHNGRCYLFVVPVVLMNAMQFAYLFRIWDDFPAFILNTFFAVTIFYALLRVCIVIINRNKFEAFMMELDKLYREIECSNDVYAKNVLRRATLVVRKISIFNMTAAFLDVIGACLHPLFREKRIHPFGVAIPGVDMTLFPVYHIFYVLQLSSPFLITGLYMPFVGLFATFAIFGKTMLIILQHKLQQVCQEDDDGDIQRTEQRRYENLRSCIRYHARIVRYVKEFNSLVTYILFVEFMLFGAILCALLFCMTIIVSLTQTICLSMYIMTILYVLFNFYWQANQLFIESLKVPEAAVAMAWYNSSPRFKKTLLIFVMLSQKPLKIMLGNTFPMSLETYQSLLNASYSYYTVLRGVYK